MNTLQELYWRLTDILGDIQQKRKEREQQRQNRKKVKYWREKANTYEILYLASEEANRQLNEDNKKLRNKLMKKNCSNAKYTREKEVIKSEKK